MNYDKHLQQLWRKQELKRLRKHRYLALQDTLSIVSTVLGGLVLVTLVAITMWFISGQLK